MSKKVMIALEIEVSDKDRLKCEEECRLVPRWDEGAILCEIYWKEIINGYRFLWRMCWWGI